MPTTTTLDRVPARIAPTLQAPWRRGARPGFRGLAENSPRRHDRRRRLQQRVPTNSALAPFGCRQSSALTIASFKRADGERAIGLRHRDRPDPAAFLHLDALADSPGNKCEGSLRLRVIAATMASPTSSGQPPTATVRLAARGMRPLGRRPPQPAQGFTARPVDALEAPAGLREDLPAVFESFEAG